MNENWEVYNQPSYYEIAFSFRDIEREVEIIEKCISLYSQIPVHRVLELGCGPAPHMAELCTRGYEYFGLDLNDQMLHYAEARALAAGFSPTFLHADMNRFSLPEQADFVFILLGSLYARSTQELETHFKSVAKALKPGGLYFLDWCVEFSPLMNKADSWVTEKNDCRIMTSYFVEIIDPAAQIFQEVIVLKVRDNQDKERTIEEKHVKRAIFPQEFLLLIEKVGGFEFIGWWNNWNLAEPLREGSSPPATIERPIALLRRM